MFDDNTAEIYNKVMVYFNGDFEAIKIFVNRASKYSDLEIREGRYRIDPRSIMGMLSLDLTEPVALIYPESRQEEIFQDFGGYIVSRELL